MSIFRLARGAWVLVVFFFAVVFSVMAIETAEAQDFRRGDCNVDGRADISDGIFVLFYNFAGEASPTCLDSCDVNDDGTVDISDAISLFNFLFAGGMEPPAPGLDACGPDPTADAIGCTSFGRCSDCPTFGVSTSSLQRNVEVVVAASGNFLAVWEDDNDLDDLFQIRAGSFTPDNLDLLDPFTVNSTSAGQQLEPAVGMSADESFVVVWQDDSNLNGLYEVRARGFNTDGTERFPQFQVNVGSSGQQLRPDIACAANKNFVVVWDDDSDSDGLFQVHTRGFNADGTELFSEFTVNTGSAGQQFASQIAMDPLGNFVVVWHDDRDENGLFEIKGRGFNADGSESIAQFTVNSSSSGQQIAPSIAMAANGDFVVAFGDDRDQDENFQVKARGFNADGTELIAQFTVNTSSAGQQSNPSVAMDSDGNFAVAYNHDGDNDGRFHIYMRAFNADGTERLEARKLNCIGPAQHFDSSAGLTESGSVLVFWDETLVGAPVQVVGRSVVESDVAP